MEKQKHNDENNLNHIKIERPQSLPFYINSFYYDLQMANDQQAFQIRSHHMTIYQMLIHHNFYAQLPS
jgi:hypothetical protein